MAWYMNTILVMFVLAIISLIVGLAFRKKLKKAKWIFYIITIILAVWGLVTIFALLG